MNNVVSIDNVKLGVIIDWKEIVDGVYKVIYIVYIKGSGFIVKLLM